MMYKKGWIIIKKQKQLDWSADRRNQASKFRGLKLFEIENGDFSVKWHLLALSAKPISNVPEKNFFKIESSFTSKKLWNRELIQQI